MANIVVSNACNMKCSYCFASQHLQEDASNAENRFISLHDFEKRLDFLNRSNIDQIRLIGGEPTLHPHFIDLIQLARKERKHIVIFSHGIIAERILDCLTEIPVPDLTVLVNMNASKYPKGPDESEQAQRINTLKRLGQRALPGFNIQTTNFNLNFLLPIIRDTGCRKSIRLGLAHPTLSRKNQFLHPKQYPSVGNKIANFATIAGKDGVNLEFDCGFVRCMFSDDDIQRLNDANADLGWRCNPILDIEINGRVAYCFPLANEMWLHLSEWSVAAEMRSELTKMSSPFRSAGIYRECSACIFKEREQCYGGCLSATMHRFKKADIHVLLPDSIYQKGLKQMSISVEHFGKGEKHVKKRST